MKTVIVGGGASGLVAAITLKRNMPSMEVVVLEKLEEPAKKLLATGNGRCNLSNAEIDVSCYHGDSSTIYQVLNTFGTGDCLDFFHSLGLLTLEEEGRLYPFTMNAATVRDVLLQEADRLGVVFQTGFRVRSIEPGFTLFGQDPASMPVSADYLLLALGGKAAAVHGTDGDGYPILKQLGIRYAPISPALTALLLDDSVRPLKGLRVRGSASLYDGEQLVAKETGELQFTENGLSGIPALQLSGDAAVLVKQGAPSLSLDFCPMLPDLAVLDYLRDRADVCRDGMVGELLTGLLQDRLAGFLLPRVGLSGDRTITSLGIQDLANLAELLKACPFPVTGTRSFKDAQVTRGGVPAEELRDGSLESRNVPGLWFAGELLNVDGACGGYNLHFAWGSGILAAKEIAQRAENQ